MDSMLFEEWVRELDNQFDKENRKIALIIDKCAAHPEIGRLKAIDLFFLPSNTTSVLQPMDQGTIHSLKARYRTKVVQKMIEAIDGNKTLPNISVLDAMKMLILSWDEVTDKIVQHCFKKAGFCEIEEDDAVSDDPFAALKDAVTQLINLGKTFEDVTVEMLHLFMTCLCQHKSHYLMRISWQTFYLLIFMPNTSPTMTRTLNLRFAKF